MEKELIKKAKKVLENNLDILEEEELCQGSAEKREDYITFKYNSQSIYNPFKDEDLFKKVNPIDYYGYEKVSEFVDRYLNLKIKVLKEETLEFLNEEKENVKNSNILPIIKNELKHCLEKAMFELESTERKEKFVLKIMKSYFCKEDNLENYQNIFYSILDFLLKKGLKDDFIFILKNLKRGFYLENELDKYINYLFSI